MQPQRKTLGVYVHIPFCLQKCNYCDFYSVPFEKDAAKRYVDVLVRHIAESASTLQSYVVDTVYIGGGTPGVLPLPLLAAVIKAINKGFHVDRRAEITMELNPASGQKKGYFTRLRKLGINRLSMGMQCANDEQLKLLGRTHTFAMTKETVLEAKKAKFQNISMDIMYGLPGQTLADVEQTIEKLLALRPNHVSAYCLTIAENTPFGRHRDTLDLPGDDAQLAMYLRIIEALGDKGYAQYEISNFARDGMCARHNMRYWQGLEYIGFGPAAHSFVNQYRFSYVADLQQYVNGVQNKESIVADTEKITPRERFAEYIMLRLRLCEGLDENDFFRRFNKPFEPYAERLAKYMPRYVQKKDGCYALTAEGMFVSNTIISDILE